MKTMRALADRVLVIFPFEEQIYRDAGVPVQWVGHPLLDVMPPPRSEGRARSTLGLSAAAPIVALLPGSRRNEVRAILPGLAAAASRIRARLPDAQFAVARAPHISDDLLRRWLDSRRAAHRARRAGRRAPAIADVALVASGRSPCRPRSTSVRWWWCTACRLSPTGSAARSSGSARSPWPTWSPGAASYPS
jgi:lipid-A-disaccharide synthase